MQNPFLRHVMLEEKVLRGNKTLKDRSGLVAMAMPLVEIGLSTDTFYSYSEYKPREPWANRPTLSPWMPMFAYWSPQCDPYVSFVLELALG